VIVGPSRDAHVVGEGPSLAENGNIAFSWPKEATGFDFLIATVTKRNLTNVGGYPEAAQIARAILDDRTNLARQYFEENRRVGITTFQDREILAHLDWRLSHRVPLRDFPVSIRPLRSFPPGGRGNPTSGPSI